MSGHPGSGDGAAMRPPAKLPAHGPTAATVCLTHLRFIPCRRQDGCRLSSDPADVERISAYQACPVEWCDQHDAPYQWCLHRGKTHPNGPSS